MRSLASAAVGMLICLALEKFRLMEVQETSQTIKLNTSEREPIWVKKREIMRTGVIKEKEMSKRGYREKQKNISEKYSCKKL